MDNLYDLNVDINLNIKQLDTLITHLSTSMYKTECAIEMLDALKDIQNNIKVNGENRNTFNCVLGWEIESMIALAHQYGLNVTVIIIGE